jgi:AcrR family transcriptional regulator
MEIEPARPGARARVRAEVTHELLAIAKQHLGIHGAAALSLRAVARDAGMVSSAVYRYFPSRDDLLTALIVDGFEQVAETTARADASVRRNDLRGRWMAIGRAVQAWAIEHPHEYSLIYGTPIPGYAAPEATIVPVQRAAATMVAILSDGVASGAITSQARALSRAEKAALAPVQTAFPDLPPDTLARGLLAWMSLFGMISFELFGHLHNVVDDKAVFFEHELGRLADLVLGTA